MAERGSSTPPGVAEGTVTALHGRWRRTLDDFDRTPGLPDGRRLRRFEALEQVEATIASTAAADLAEVVLKLRMIQSGRITGMSEAKILAGAIRDIERLNGQTGELNPSQPK